MVELIELLMDPIVIALYMILHIIGYFFVLRKMPLKRWKCIIPFLAEHELSKVLFRKMRTFYRPFIISAVFMIAALYLGSDIAMGRLFFLIAYIIYGWFLVRLYWRLGQSFQKGILFRILLILFPPVFMVILGISKAEYKAIEFKPIKKLPLVLDILNKILIVLVSGAEIAALVAVVGYITISTHLPGFLVEMSLDDFHDKTKDIKGTDQVVSREDAISEETIAKAAENSSRERFFPDHSQDKNVVVLTYIIGSNLEDGGGLASANITQMKQATKAGNSLTFVVESGGSRRWFTDGMEDKSYGRYEIKDGKLAEVESLPDDTCMAEQKTLQDFLLWAKEKYPADRYMLVLWDHGGGVPYGYGQDDVNKRTDDPADMGTMMTSEFIKAVKKSDMKFDLIGFDACLMQDIEIAAALEPYTDFYLASEETEGGYGWYYTDAFGKLAEDPGMSTEDLAVNLLSCYDQLNTIVKDDKGKPDTKATLSIVDTTLAKPAYDSFARFLEKAGEVVKDDPGAFADIAAAGSNAYNFEDNMQIDLIDYLEILADADSTDLLGADEDIQGLADTIHASVLYRNKDSAKGINGMAFAFPYKNMMHYDCTSQQLKSMSCKKERDVFNIIFSIMAAQKKKAAESGEKANDLIDPADEDGDPLSALLNDLVNEDYTKQDWYIKGFEDYDTTKSLVDIPLKETEDGYQIELPEKTKKIITDCETMVYQKTGEKGDKLKYLGRDQLGSDTDDFTISFDGNWVHIGGEAVCYEADPVRETDDGTIFSGRVRARLNGEDDIMLMVEWDPVKDDTEEAVNGHITGYYLTDTDVLSGLFNTKNNLNLETGDKLQFVFDTYDMEGNVVKTAPAGKTIRVIKQSDITVEDAPLEECDIVFNGMLTDVYQRTMTTEQLEMHLGAE